MSWLQSELDNLQPPKAKVYLVGAGPGDPGLLTLKALHILKHADCVLYDTLVSKAILDLIPDSAEKIHVGKQKSVYVLPQEGINSLLIEKAGEGKVCVRLKGGDPFIFGRGGEEILALAEAGTDFEVVPGITSAIGIAAEYNLPLTHRDFASTLVFTTGHNLIAGDLPDVEWPIFAQGKKCLVVYMALSNLGKLTERLLTTDKATAELPVMIVGQGTTPDSKAVKATLSTIEAEVKKANIASPALVIIGGSLRIDGFGKKNQP